MGEQTRPPADAAHLAEQAELRRLIRATLAELQPEEHEIFELSIRHGLHEAELAAVLGMSRYRAQALASRARDHLAKILEGLLIARAARRSCPELGSLLANWDGRLTVQTGKVAAEHIEHCERCTPPRHGPLRPEVLSSLLPLAPLPPELREPTLERARQCDPASGGRDDLADLTCGACRLPATWSAPRVEQDQGQSWGHYGHSSRGGVGDGGHERHADRAHRRA